MVEMDAALHDQKEVLIMYCIKIRIFPVLGHILMVIEKWENGQRNHTEI